MKLLDFLKRQKPKVSPKISAIPIPKAIPIIAGMTFAQWRSNPENITALRSVFQSNAILSSWLGVAWAEIPRNYPARGMNVTAESAAVELGRFNGYTACLDLLQACLEYPPRKQDEIPQTYETPIDQSEEQ